MESNNFKINDIVLYTGNRPDVKKHRQCKIVGDKSTPYEFGFPVGLIYADGGNDFVSEQIFTNEDREQGTTLLPIIKVELREIQPME